jgi:hypothetical protein
MDFSHWRILRQEGGETRFSAFFCVSSTPAAACWRRCFIRQKDMGKIFAHCGGSERLKKIPKKMKLGVDK